MTFQAQYPCGHATCVSPDGHWECLGHPDDYDLHQVEMSECIDFAPEDIRRRYEEQVSDAEYEVER